MLTKFAAHVRGILRMHFRYSCQTCKDALRKATCHDHFQLQQLHIHLSHAYKQMQLIQLFPSKVLHLFMEMCINWLSALLHLWQFCQQTTTSHYSPNLILMFPCNPLAVTYFNIANNFLNFLGLPLIIIALCINLIRSWITGLLIHWMNQLICL